MAFEISKQKWRREKGKKEKESYELDAPVLTIGRDSKCGVTLDDPILSGKHAQLELIQGHYFVEDLGSATGSYLNGVRLDGKEPVKPGDVLRLGQTKITFDRAAEPDANLVLQVAERGLYRSAKARPGEWQPGEREAWREAEISFSHFPLLWGLAWGSGLVALVILGLVLLPGAREQVAEPGRLHSTHAALFDGSIELTPALQAIVDSGCDSCHDSWNSVPQAKCLECHAEIATMHPFKESAAENWPDDACALCHVDHQNTENRAQPTQLDPVPSGWPSELLVSRADAAFVPVAHKSGASCSEFGCHRDRPFAETGEDSAYVRGTRHLSQIDLARVVPARHEKIPFATFDHRQHLQSVEECSHCHRPSRNPEDGRDFTPIDFAGCMECHLKTGGDQLVQSTSRSPTQVAQAPDFDVRWHGAQANPQASPPQPSPCLDCHAELYDPLLKQIEREVSTYPVAAELARADLESSLSWYRFEVRDHTSEVEAAAQLKPGLNCQKCHQNPGAWLHRSQERYGVFWHTLHVSPDHLKPEGPVEECESCHQKTIHSSSLSEHFVGDLTQCGDCHVEGSMHEAARDAALTQRVTSHNFPHEPHLQVEGSCRACHDLEQSGKRVNEVVPETRESVRDCRECHGGEDRPTAEFHANVGGGACTLCHTAGREDPVYFARLSDQDWPLTRPRLDNFDHFSTGHLEQTTKDCLHCHGDVVDAASLDQIAVPTLTRESEETCRKCHLQSRQVFHWR